MKNTFNKKIIITLLVLTIILTLFAGCVKKDIDTVVHLTDDKKTVYIHTQRQIDYLHAPSYAAGLYAKGKAEYSKPKGITLKWDEFPNDGKYEVIVSEKQNMNDAVTYQTTETNLKITNLKIGTNYYWKVANDKTGKTGSFYVSSTAPRNLSVDGVTNVRDLGGWSLGDGKSVKQGMIYRCGRLNKSSADSPVIEITADGIKTMREVMGVKSEIDLREVDNGEIGGITSSPLGGDVQYVNIPMKWDGDMWNDNKDKILETFAFLADKDNYPLIFHCNIGTDRTGMIAFLINALLGVEESDLIKDYLFSNLGNIGGARHKSGVTDSPYYKAVQSAIGSDLKEKTYNALANFGVPAYQLDSIINLLTTNILA